MNILIIENELAVLKPMVAALRHEKYHCEAVVNYAEALEKVSFYDYDVIIMNYKLPGAPGLITELKSKGSGTGIIIISANGTIEEKVTALESGADDYLIKPFDMSELVARVKSFIRRRDYNGHNEIILDELKFNLDQKSVMVNEQPLDLTRKELDLFQYLLANRNRILSKEAIADHLRGDGEYLVMSYDFIYSHVKNLRKKIMDKGGRDYIMTIYGIGYKLVSG